MAEPGLVDRTVEAPRGETPPDGPAGVRRPVAVLVSRFPSITETFVLRELIELERRGQPLVLVPLIRESPDVVHPEAAPWVDRALYSPWISGRIVAASLRRLRRQPRTVLSLARRWILGRGLGWGFRWRTAALFPKTLYLAELLEGTDVRHLHAHFATHPTTVAHLVSKLTGLSYSLTAHAHDIFVSRDRLEEKLADARWARMISDYNAELVSSLYPALDPRRLRVIRVGVDHRHLARLDAGRQPVPEPSGLLAVAALKPYKGLDVLVTACRLLRDRGRDVRCDVVGEGPERARLERRVEALDLADTVRLLGAREQAEVAERMRRATVVVQPSVIADDGQMEGIPVALMEALAARRPVVASRLSGIPELVEDGVTGLLVPPGDPEALADAVERLLDDPELGRELGRRGRERVRERFDLGTTVDQLLAALDATEPVAEDGDLETARRLAARAGATAVGLRATRKRADSEVSRLLLAVPRPASVTDPSRRDPATLEAVFKRHLARPGASREATERARIEHDVLRCLQPEQADDPVPRAGAAPRPLAFDEATAGLLMTWEPGEGLDERLRRLRFARPGRFDRLVADVTAAGAWLRAFQRRVPVSGLEARAEAVVERLRREGEGSLDALAAELGDERRAALRRRLAELHAAVLSERPPIVARHGDFWPGNLRTTETGIVGLDFEGVRPGLVTEDAATFLLHLDAYLAWPGLGRRRRELVAAFRAGLDRPIAGPTAALGELWATLTVLHHAPAPMTAADRWRRRRLRVRLAAR